MRSAGVISAVVGFPEYLSGSSSIVLGAAARARPAVVACALASAGAASSTPSAKPAAVRDNDINDLREDRMKSETRSRTRAREGESAPLPGARRCRPAGSTGYEYPGTGCRVLPGYSAYHSHGVGSRPAGTRI